MKYRSGITLLLVSALSLYTAVREPNHKQIKQMSLMRRNRGVQKDIAALMCSTHMPHKTSEKDIVVAGAITMPTEGERAGTGTGFSYVADAQAGTIVITFNELVSPTVTATAQDLDTTRTVKIVHQTENMVTLSISDFSAENPTVVEFNAIQFENA